MSRGPDSATFPTPMEEAGAGMSDADALLLFIRERSQEAFSVIYKRHAPMIKGACQRILGTSAAETDDALQNTFLVLARKARDVDGHAMAAWLHGVAIRCSRELLRERSRRSQREKNTHGLAPRDTPATLTDLESDLDAALQRLSPTLKQAVLLCHLERMTLREAAALAGCPAATMGWRVAEGVKRLREDLQRRRGTCELSLVVALLGRQAHLAHQLALPAAPVAPTAAVSLPLLAALGAAALLVAGSAAAVLQHRPAHIASPISPVASPQTPLPAAHLERLAPVLPSPLGTILTQTAASALCFTPDGSLVIGEENGDIIVTDVDSGQTLRHLQGHTRRVTAVAASPDGQLIASGGDYGDGGLRLWPAHGVQSRLMAGPSVFDSLEFSHDGTHLLSGEDNSNTPIRLWEVQSGSPLPFHPDFHDLSHTARYSPDGTFCANGSRDHAVHIWRLADNQLMASWPFVVSQLCSIAFSPDGRELCASGGWGGDDANLVRRWRFPSGEELPPLVLSHLNCGSIAFSPDGSTLACAGIDLQLFDAKSGRSLGTLAQGLGEKAALAYGLCGASQAPTLACIDGVRPVRIWRTQRP